MLYRHHIHHLRQLTGWVAPACFRSSQQGQAARCRPSTLRKADFKARAVASVLTLFSLSVQANAFFNPVMPLAPLGFGSVAALGPGSVTMHPVGGRTAEGQVFLVHPDHGAPAQVLVRSTHPNQVFSINLPDHFELSTSARQAAMNVAALRTQPGLKSTGPGSSTTVTIGATLYFKSQAVPGTFEGAFALTVAYH